MITHNPSHVINTTIYVCAKFQLYLKLLWIRTNVIVFTAMVIFYKLIDCMTWLVGFVSLLAHLVNVQSYS
eukprot:m.80711 g.80711  ORF g.80711 m.80711 type:complete len:70 (+) comp12608_c1_seq1:752-961(+)